MAWLYNNIFNTNAPFLLEKKNEYLHNQQMGDEYLHNQQRSAQGSDRCCFEVLYKGMLQGRYLGEVVTNFVTE